MDAGRIQAQTAERRLFLILRQEILTLELTGTAQFAVSELSDLLAEIMED